MEFIAGTTRLEFIQTELQFQPGLFKNLFVQKNNRTLAYTLDQKRYAFLKPTIIQRYPLSPGIELGTFLYSLKLNGDNLYLKFLNKYGDLIYCRFSFNDPQLSQRRGLYAYTVNNQVKYIGQTIDTFKKRINLGYGVIHPKNCYLDGQATNCHLNALIAENKNELKFYICPLQDPIQIGIFEKLLIQHHNPSWNIALKLNS